MKYIFLSLLLALSVSAQDQKKPERKGPPPGERPKHDGPPKDGDRPTKPKKN